MILIVVYTNNNKFVSGVILNKYRQLSPVFLVITPTHPYRPQSIENNTEKLAKERPVFVHTATSANHNQAGLLPHRARLQQ